MPNTDAVNDIVIRPAQPDDKPVVMEFCQHTWKDAEDYIPEVWDKWLADPSGQIFVAVLQERPVAMARAVKLSQQEGWWEGLRVDLQYRRLGLARVLEAHISQYLQQVGVTITRCCVATWNTAAHPFMKQQGYHKIDNYILHRADATDSSTPQISRLGLESFDAARSLVHQSQSNRLFVCRGAKWQALTAQVLRDRLNQGLVWGIEHEKVLQSVFLQSHLESSNEALWVGCIEGREDSLPVMLSGMCHLARQQGYEAVSGFFPKREPILNALQKAGYQLLPEEEFWIYEKSLQQK
ncbi:MULTISPECIES: GNAT family N-acetyltransferase [Trichocoleus]|uniref:GNAT family N-acetyltransferase n=1 Tax=Trichocoleus desertorum GB2-A4 TaxID=2933944 RepID=A0ABV0JC32_9CYAN|nr:GNAT family N-acetyltransferase [Trichocoleus sp. FACHB-46]MBD1863993.1 GNAT family N-acetyltransferase [Trichocoleus sp. FACHB-46]